MKQLSMVTSIRNWGIIEIDTDIVKHKLPIIYFHKWSDKIEMIWYLVYFIISNIPLPNLSSDPFMVIFYEQDIKLKIKDVLNLN